MYTLDKSLIDKFCKQIQSEIDELSYATSRGRFDDIISYQKTCAKIDGLETALSIFKDLVKKLGEANEDK